MGQVLAGCRPGGILALLTLVDEHREAIEYDCLRVGIRLSHMGTGHEWSELKAVVKHSLRDPHSDLFFALAPDDAGWGKLEQLLAELVDTAHWLKWAKTSDAKYKRNHPKPIPRPGVQKPERIGEDPIPMDEMDEWLGWNKTA